ncbi:hypothetical protein MLD38_022092 [Melastoma candidum]|uniref:Uncharacterized protein n=2 Tax=Melastoma candidum TaxID=119954 RepID=A0ACB9QHG5_9MYRT|nr:hypothetical protein MLD38_022092 [Melastoma candidum]
MCYQRSSSSASFFSAALLAATLVAIQVSAQGSAPTSSSKWLTLSGNAPVVVARGGFSGILPDSSSLAYQVASVTSASDVVFWCDIQLTKDGVGICAPDVNLDNSTNIANVYKDRRNSYVINGVSTQGWFSIDFTIMDLASVNLIRGILSRTDRFDGDALSIITVQDLAANYSPPGLWLNVQHDVFFTQHKLSMRSFVLSVARSTFVNYISSPEVAFLKSVASRISAKTELIFRFLGQSDLEPSTNQTYGSFLKKLTSVKAFASGILVPKSYIWPVDAGNYLLPSTTLVNDAHKAGLIVFAADFANDVPFSYNFSYDPVAETLSFIDNGAFSVDGVLTDFPITPSEAIGCYAHLGKNSTAQAPVLVISYNGASGDYPGCTDVAYANAISDGADIIDCNVQMSMDGIPFCLSSVNLIDSSLVAQSSFSNLTTLVPEIQSANGIFPFSLTWSDIQTLTPSISTPYSSGYHLFRNPRNKNAGKFVSLSDFLSMAKNSSVSGVLISIENAAYLARYKGLDVTDTVLDTLDKAGYSNQTMKKVMIKSANSSVLEKIKGNSNYELVYELDENFSDATNSTIQDIKSFAHSVIITRTSIYPESAFFITGMTDFVTKLQAFKLSVYVQVLSNEFVSQPYDYFSDATVQLNSFVMGAGVDGVITDFPKTAAAYKRNKCLSLGRKIPNYMTPVLPGSLMQLISTPMLPPAEAPYPVLTEADITEPPLPPISARPPTLSPPGSSMPPPPNGKNGQSRVAARTVLSCMAGFLAILPLL